MQTPHLVVIPAVPIWQQGDVISFDRKFYDGLLLYQQLWPGQMSCIVVRSNSADLPQFGLVQHQHDKIPFDCTVLPAGTAIAPHHLEAADIVLAAGDALEQLHVSQICQRAQAKCVYIIEYIPETRYQIARLSTSNPLKKLRRYVYIWNGERQRLAAFQLAAGLQSNGMAAFQEYAQIGNNLLYFDTRVTQKLFIRDAELETRLQRLAQQKPLQLAFSGRLIAIKGADQLIQLAQILRARHLEFHFTIYGAGELEAAMQHSIQEHQLNAWVSLPGAVDFEQELLPALQANIDLFVMLHRQSDPSCTYLETLACGIPIVGYQNRAFAGLLEQAEIGWGAPLNDLNAIAAIIQRLAVDREAIAAKSRSSLAFARQHDFETTFQNRINHLVALVS